MKIIKVISEWKKKPKLDLDRIVKENQKMVEAIVEINGEMCTRHIAIPR